MAAVAESGFVLQWVSDRLRDDKEIVLAAIKQNSVAYHFASDRLKHDGDVVTLLLGKNRNNIRHIPVHIRNELLIRAYQTHD